MKGKIICWISLLFLLKSLIFAGKNHEAMCIHASRDFSPLEPSRGPMARIPLLIKHSLSKNRWDTSLSSCPSNVGALDLVS